MTPEDDDLHAHRALDGLLVFDARRNRIHYLNPAGAAVLEHARRPPGIGIDPAPADGGILAPPPALEQFLEVLAREELIAVQDHEERDVPGGIIAEETCGAEGTDEPQPRFGKPLINSYTITDRNREPVHSSPYPVDADIGANDIDLDDFLYFHGGEFVTVAYQWLLGRDPDPDGYKHYLERLEVGEATRETILRDIRNSEEGRQCNIRIKGL